MEQNRCLLSRMNPDGSEGRLLKNYKRHIWHISALEYQDGFIEGEEIKPDGEAFVTVTYAIKYANGKRKAGKRAFRVVNEEGIWKLRVPGFFEGSD